MRIISFLVCLLLAFPVMAAKVKPLIIITKSCDQYVLAFGTGTNGEIEGYIVDFTPAEQALMNSILSEVQQGNGKLQIIQSSLVCV